MSRSLHVQAYAAPPSVPPAQLAAVNSQYTAPQHVDASNFDSSPMEIDSDDSPRPAEEADTFDYLQLMHGSNTQPAKPVLQQPSQYQQTIIHVPAVSLPAPAKPLQAHSVIQSVTVKQEPTDNIAYQPPQGS